MTTAAEVSVADVLTIVAQNAKQLESLNGKVDGLVTDVKVLKSAVSGLDARMGAIETRMGSLEDRFVRFDSHVQGMRQDLHDQGEIMKNRFPPPGG